MAKVITRQIHEKLDNFVFQGNVEHSNQDFNNSKQELKKERVIKKKSDGLIEKMDNKIYITEDNRQLLND